MRPEGREPTGCVRLCRRIPLWRRGGAVGWGEVEGWIGELSVPEPKALSRFAPVFVALRLGGLPPQSRTPRAIPNPVTSTGFIIPRPRPN
jgi:hypothetical protein